MSGNNGEGYCERCECWRTSLVCPNCGLITIPAQVEQRLLSVSKELDTEILTVAGRTRYNPSYPSRAFIGEIYNALIAAYRLGAEGRSKRLGSESRSPARRSSV